MNASYRRVTRDNKLRSWIWKVGLLTAALGLAHCGSSKTTVNRAGGGGKGGTSNGGANTGGTGNTNVFEDAGIINNNSGFDSGTMGSGGTAADAASVTLNLQLGDSGVAVAVKLVCNPGALQVSGMPVTTQCYVELEGGTHAVDVVWIVDDTRVGSIGNDGVFRANGFVGGVVKVTAKVGTSAGTYDITTSITVDFAAQNNTGNISGADIGKMQAGGTGDGGFGWLYPYDRTVFPRGLQPPELQFKGNCTPTATYLKITLPHYSYDQAAAGGSPMRVTIPPAIWKGVTLSTTGTDPVNVEVTKLCSGGAAGPIKEQWGIAPQKLKGSVYYATYSSPSLGPNGAEQQGMVRLRFGSNAEAFIRPDDPDAPRNCYICHSVSANGEVLLATDENLHNAYNTQTGAVPPPVIRDLGFPKMGFYPALTPDGRRTLTSGGDEATQGKNAGAARPSILVNTDTGAAIATSPATLPRMYIPAFSPDSRHVAFTNILVGNNSLSIMDYNGNQNPPLFSNLTEVASTGGTILTFPSYIPDSRAVVYQEGSSYYTDGPAMPYEVRLVETDTKSINGLKALNGYLSDGSFYLPYGASQDGGSGFAPTVMPRPIGGYYWVIFGSRRAYGNHLAPGGTEGGTSPGDLIRKKVWISAVDIDHWGKADPSHPAFFLEGQPFDTDAKRPFVALDPCAPQGASCETGADCCDGFCRETGREPDGTPILTCVPPLAPGTGCSNLDEYCSTPADCCDPSLLCIVNRCSLPTPPIIY